MAFKKYDTRTDISSKEESTISWVQIKIQESTKDRLKKMAFIEEKEMQEIANKVMEQFLTENGY